MHWLKYCSDLSDQQLFFLLLFCDEIVLSCTAVYDGCPENIPCRVNSSCIKMFVTALMMECYKLFFNIESIENKSVVMVIFRYKLMKAKQARRGMQNQLYGKANKALKSK